MSHNILLVVGKDGQLGQTLFQDLLFSGVKVIGTTHHQDKLNQDSFFLDLSYNPETWKIPNEITAAFICSSITKLDLCKKDPIKTANVNVTGIYELTKKLVEKGVYVVVMSTGHVFDGTIPYHKPEDPYSPVDVYGIQKVEMEKKLKTLGDSVSIVRSARLLGPRMTRIIKWKKSLLKGEIIKPFSDYFLAPVPYPTLATLLQLIAQRQLSGIIQISGTRDISYADAAYIGAKALKVNSDLVQPHTTTESGFKEHVFRNTRLDMSRLLDTFGFLPPEVEWTIEKAFTAAV